jgi:hypothetical protein
MNRLARLILASGAGLTLALTASPALGEPPSDSGSNSATVERVEYSNTDGSTSEYRATTRRHGDDYYTTNSRDQSTYGESSFDDKTQYTELENVTKLTSQSTGPNEDGVTCRTNSQHVTANGETRRDSWRKIC